MDAMSIERIYGRRGRSRLSLTRRGFLRAATGAGGLMLLAATPAAAAVERATRATLAASPTRVDADEALGKLMDGNRRFAASVLEHPDQTSDRRLAVAQGQHPFAVVLGCADSRVAPEIVFDQGVGDLFTIRVAGNIADDAVLGSIEYAVEHLDVSLVMVLGHERCGAVQAAVDSVTGGGEVPMHISALVDPIRPAVERAQGQTGDLVDNAVRANVELVTSQLKAAEPILAEMVEAHHVKIVGARYDLDSGTVEIIA